MTKQVRVLRATFAPPGAPTAYYYLVGSREDSLRFWVLARQPGVAVDDVRVTPQPVFMEANTQWENLLRDAVAAYRADAERRGVPPARPDATTREETRVDEGVVAGLDTDAPRVLRIIDDAIARTTGGGPSPAAAQRRIARAAEDASPRPSRRAPRDSANTGQGTVAGLDRLETVQARAREAIEHARADPRGSLVVLAEIRDAMAALRRGFVEAETYVATLEALIADAMSGRA